MSIFGSKLIPTGKYVAHHPEAERITTDCGDDIEQALQIAYDEDDECEFQNGDCIAISLVHEWMPTVDGARAGDPSAALGMTRDWADYTAGHFNRVARLDETRYTYDVLLRIDAVAGFNAAAFAMLPLNRWPKLNACQPNSQQLTIA